MDGSLYVLAEQITTHGFIVALFIFGFIATLLSSIVLPRENHQKLCGTLAIFLIALVVNDNKFYYLSIFIGGLVVASEDFMLMFVSIIKADRKDVLKIAQTFYDLRKIAKNQFSSPVRENIEAISNEQPSEPSDVPIKQQ